MLSYVRTYTQKGTPYPHIIIHKTQHNTNTNTILQLSDAFLVAKAFFNVGEYKRAAHTLEKAQEKRLQRGKGGGGGQV